MVIEPYPNIIFRILAFLIGLYVEFSTYNSWRKQRIEVVWNMGFLRAAENTYTRQTTPIRFWIIVSVFMLIGIALLLSAFFNIQRIRS